MEENLRGDIATRAALLEILMKDIRAMGTTWLYMEVFQQLENLLVTSAYLISRRKFGLR
jgi:hypothetical protein